MTEADQIQVKENTSGAEEFQNLYSPSTLLGVYASALRSPADGRIIITKGIYQPSGNQKEYSGYYFDSIRGINDSTFIKAKIPAFLRSKLQYNAVYIFKGHIEKKIGFSSIELTLTVDDIFRKEENQINEAELKNFELIRKKVVKGYRDFEALVKESIYKGNSLKIANIYGNNAIVHKDFEKGLGTAMTKFNISEHRCSFASKSEISSKLKALDNAGYDVLALVRGGGDGGLEIFNDPVLTAEVIELKPLLVTALGHTVNETVMDKLADKKFALPFDYGITLRLWTEQAIEEQSKSKSVFMDQVKADLTKTYTEQLSSLQTQLLTRNKEFDKLQFIVSEQNEKLILLNRKLLYYVLGSFVAGVLIGFILRLF